MKLENLKKSSVQKSKRIGRGPGSGKGKTSGRGQKGQNARGSLAITHSHFEGGQRPLIKRLPYRRGKGNKKVSQKPLGVNLTDLANFPKSQQVTVETLIKEKIVSTDAKKYGVKILGEGEIREALTFNLPTSKSAREKIEKSKGKIIYATKTK